MHQAIEPVKKVVSVPNDAVDFMGMYFTVKGQVALRGEAQSVHGQATYIKYPLICTPFFHYDLLTWSDAKGIWIYHCSSNNPYDAGFLETTEKAWKNCRTWILVDGQSGIVRRALWAESQPVVECDYV